MDAPTKDGAPAVHGLSHLTFIARDLERMARFMCQGLGATQVYASDGREHSIAPERFFELAGLWIVAMQGEPPAERSYQHAAFQVDPEDLPRHRARLEAIGVEVSEGRWRIEGEGMSLYFHDFDNHLFELHTGSLALRLECYRNART
ncbi:MAG TPA: FosX/FosE/FosI family fosfomycin resistance hydrolase [Pseudoxanthomonas sp.]|nr:FosX/FosE/FosI family fosfomycin resistance hydrolase [Pseudoxanthomonas sp.]